jgi:hypothetical protein
MSPPSQRHSFTFPHGFLDLLRISPGRRYHIGDYELDPARLERFNHALHELSPEAPGLTLDQFASAGNRALARHADHGTPPFVLSRMDSLGRLGELVADATWRPAAELVSKVDLLIGYRRASDDLIPDHLPVVGLLDDAVLVDVALQLLRDELADYEDFCRFRRIAADFAGMSEADTGLTRMQWLEAMLQARRNPGEFAAPTRDQRYIADPRASLFHVT